MKHRMNRETSKNQRFMNTSKSELVKDISKILWDFKSSVLVGWAILLSAVVLSYGVIVDFEISNLEVKTIDTKVFSTKSPFADIDIKARSAFVWDIKQSKILFEKNSEEVLPLASITKIASVVSALEMTDSKEIIRLTKETIEVDGDNGLLVDERWELDNLIDFALITSSNDAAHALASVVSSRVKNGNSPEDQFVLEMNQFVSKIGLKSLRFNNPSGLDVNETVSGGYGNAIDVAMLMEHAIINYPEIFEATRHESVNLVSVNNIHHRASNTNQDVIKTGNLLASKTGYTDLSGGNLVVALDATIGRPVIIVVLGSTFEGRFSDVQKLTDATIRHFRNESLKNG